MRVLFQCPSCVACPLVFGAYSNTAENRRIRFIRLRDAYVIEWFGDSWTWLVRSPWLGGTFSVCLAVVVVRRDKVQDLFKELGGQLKLSSKNERQSYSCRTESKSFRQSQLKSSGTSTWTLPRSVEAWLWMTHIPPRPVEGGKVESDPASEDLQISMVVSLTTSGSCSQQTNKQKN